MSDQFGHEQPSGEPPPAFASYPRTSGPETPLGPPTLDFNVIGRAFTLFQANLSTWLTAGLVVGVAYVVTIGAVYGAMIFTMFGSGLFSQRSSDPTAMLPLFGVEMVGIFALNLMVLLIHALLINLAVKHVNGEQISGASLLDFRGQGLKLLGATLLVGLIVMTASMFCVFPGFIAQGLLMFTLPFVVDKRLSITQAIQASYQTLQPQMWMATLMYFVLSIIGGLGGFLCGIGIMFTYPIFVLSIALLYRDLTAERPAYNPPPVRGL